MAMHEPRVGGVESEGAGPAGRGVLAARFEPTPASAADHAPQETPLLSLRDVSKAFGGVQALQGVNMDVSGPGVVHGLIGANGSGKSTLLSVLSGVASADAGEILLDGKKAEFRGPRDALASGIAMVSQEIALAPHLTVAENILMGRRQTRSRWGINWPDTCRRAVSVLRLLELDYDPRRLVSGLRPDQRQMVEIARALSLDTKVLILDEPTSSLSDDEVRSLFAAIRRLQVQGVSTIFVSHRLPEMFELTDELTVLRDGRTVAHGSTTGFDASSLVAAMVGVRPAGATAGRTTRTVTAGTPRLSLRGASSAGAFAGIDLDVAPGEVVGVAGLVGSGRGELLESLFGFRPLTSGSVTVDGRALTTSTPSSAIDAGLGYLPPDRKADGVVLQRSIADNLSMVTTLKRGRCRGPQAADRRRAGELQTAMSIRAETLGVAVSSLSGGNQQKVAIGKWLGAQRRVLLLDEPTRGVDVAAKAEIHQLLRHAGQGGTSLLVSSSETDELISLCDRILVMHAGCVVGDFAAADVTETQITRLAGGHP